MRTFRRASALVATLLAAAAAAVVVTPGAAAAPSTYYSVPYSDVLIRHFHYSDGTSTSYEASYEQWARDGRPTPSGAPVQYVKYPWSSAIYAVSFFDGDRESWYWEQLTYDQWRRAGSPAAVSAGWIEGSQYYRWASSDELFVEAPDGSVHKLTSAEWAASGFYPPTTRWSQGFYKYSWSGSIGYLYDTRSGDGYPISYEDWRAEGFPTPQTVNGVVGQDVYKFSFSPQLYLDSAILWSHPLTGAQWAALGRPAPRTY